MLSISILVVDDESFVAENLKLKLKRLDYPDIEYRVTACSSAYQALEEIKHQKFDIIFTDIRMPFMDGLALSELVSREFPEIKIVIISGYDDFEYARQAISIGVDRYLLKPITKKALLDVLEELKAKIVQKSQRTAV